MAEKSTSNMRYAAPSGSVAAMSVRLDSVVHADMTVAAGLLGMSMNAAVNEACVMWLGSTDVRAAVEEKGSAYADSVTATINRLSGKDPQ